ncbi:hypothetical protein [Streptomyces mirabilis]|uniref:hypothetical protein n=1 Tax=Streptomyces mirabilis TaxID=68239 RepID=UPI00368764B1
MALTQQFARVTPEYLARCRGSALDSPGAAPHGDPPPDDVLDTDRALWGLLRYCRGTARCAPPPRRPLALLEADIDQVLAGLPDDPAAAASAVGFQGFRGDVRSTWSSSSSR